MRFHAAVQGARGGVQENAWARPRRARLSLQPVRRAGARERGRDRIVLRNQLRSHLSAVCQGGCQRRQGRAALPVSEEGQAGRARIRGHQMELHQVPGRPQGQRRRALRAQRRTGSDRRRYRKTVVIRATRSIIAIFGAFVAALGVAAAVAADLNKTLRVSFPIAETGFDPQPVGDVYSAYVDRMIFDPLYRYDYLARPYKIVPNTATAMPEGAA